MNLGSMSRLGTTILSASDFYARTFFENMDFFPPANLWTASTQNNGEIRAPSLFLGQLWTKLCSRRVFAQRVDGQNVIIDILDLRCLTREVHPAKGPPSVLEIETNSNKKVSFCSCFLESYTWSTCRFLSRMQFSKLPPFGSPSIQALYTTRSAVL